MDIHPHVPHEAHKPMLEQHQATWKGVTRLALYTTVVILVLLALMAVFLVKRYS